MKFCLLHSFITQFLLGGTMRSLLCKAIAESSEVCISSHALAHRCGQKRLVVVPIVLLPVVHFDQQRQPCRQVQDEGHPVVYYFLEFIRHTVSGLYITIS